MRRLRLLFFGTPEIAVPTLERLIAGPHDVVGVVSQPDRARGRGRKQSPSPVSAVALREDITLIRPERVGDAAAIEPMRALRPDLGIVVAFGQFLPRKVRELPSCGYLINAHASLLPKYRGASPIAQAILDGEAETGVSIMRIEREMDAGPVALVIRTPIETRENTLELSNRLAQLAANGIEEAVEKISQGTVEWTEQDASLASVAPKLEKSDAVLDLRDSAQALACRIHALSPRPGGTLVLESEDAEAVDGTVLKVLQADFAPLDMTDRIPGEPPGKTTDPAPGTIDHDSLGVALRIATGDGWLIPLIVQRAGGKALSITDFLRGFDLPADTHCALPTPIARAST